ncbi:MAG: glycoside hydrolase family 95 protein [Cyclobacteriaceae bacterium]|nr:glycoside hydrolase family 95 protein [Cyclobacteriaceae bacterium]
MFKNLFFSAVLFLLQAAAAYAQPFDLPPAHEIWDNKPAPNRGSDYGQVVSRGYPFDADWESHSYPIGNGYMGASIFGRTDVERIQIAEKTMGIAAPYGSGGITGLSELYLDFHHYNPEHYKRALHLNDAIMHVEYRHNGVKYSREYFASYPHNVMAVKLSADKNGSISFTLRGENPHLRGINEMNARTGEIRTKDGLMVLSGTVPPLSLNYETQVKVIPEGGQLFSADDNSQSGIRVENANSVVILIAAGTNFELSSHIYLEKALDKKLNPKKFPHDAVSKRMETAAMLGFEQLRKVHTADYQKIFDRTAIHLSAEIPQLPTSTLLENYKKGNTHPYLEELMFYFGRYLLISSSRKGTLPANLQGVWTHYAVTPWSGGYWHNINVQMNYWGAFSANMAETFIPYLEYFQAYLPQARKVATDFIRKYNPQHLNQDENANGWAIGTGANAYSIPSPGGHSGPGTGGFTTKLLWDYYEFTKDTHFLRTIAYPALFEMGVFLSKTLVPSENGVLLVSPSASPEIRVRDSLGRFSGDYYVTIGTTFDQAFVWETYNDLLKAATILQKEDPFLNVVKKQITQLDPIKIGASGQIKEFREENSYGEIGDPRHRHISHLCALYPGTLINASRPDWMQAARFVLDQRGNKTTGWALMHRMNTRARLKDAEQAWEAYSVLIKERTLPNLWATHPPFQIDANLGLVAGVAEMLLQSHENYIEILPALPAAWKTGNFQGLVARGNFEVSAQWQNSMLSMVTVISNMGGICSIRLDHEKVGLIKDTAGNKVEFTEYENNIVRFHTIAGGNYSIEFVR